MAGRFYKMISIIIPTFNEDQTISNTIQHINYSSKTTDFEIIVVDGGSTDNTVSIAEKSNCKIFTTLPGRGTQLNKGASVATGDILLFLHADTFLPRDFDEAIFSALPQQSIIGWGRFDVELSGKQYIFRLIEKLISFRSRITGIATGDQAIFVSNTLFKRVSGYQNIPLMEDVDMSKRLNRIIKPKCLKNKVVTSSRRWEKKGIIRTIFLMWMLRFLYFIGVNPITLKKLYT